MNEIVDASGGRSWRSKFAHRLMPKLGEYWPGLTRIGVNHEPPGYFSDWFNQIRDHNITMARRSGRRDRDVAVVQRLRHQINGGACPSGIIAEPLEQIEVNMRYLVRARVKPGCESALLEAIQNETLGQGSVAGDEYLRNMQEARLFDDGTARWVEVCYCATPLVEERPYWEEYFDLVKVQDAHERKNCRDENGSEPWACGECDCTQKLEERLAGSGQRFLETLER